MDTSNVKPYVFLSYSRQDRAFVERLATDLQQSSVEVWRDVEQIVAGTNWQDAIAHGLLNAFALLYVSSENSVGSAWLDEELSIALRHGTQVVPIVLDDAGAANLPEPLRAIQWIDFRLGYDRGLRAVLAALPSSVREGGPAESRRTVSKGYVFLSYAEEDSQFVNELKSFLKDYGYAYWDYRESDRDYHAQLFLELESVISEASATLSVLSPAWKISRMATKEYVYSEEVGNPVFLLRAKQLEPTLAIAGATYIDFVVDQEAGFKELHRELRKKGL
jgi:hypothetical protein